MTIRANRLNKEIELLTESAPPGVSCWFKENSLVNLEAVIMPPSGCPYETGSFKLEIEIPERYPFEPPNIKFVTPIYHPNVDLSGRVCLDILRMPPQGSWKPSQNLSTVLTSIRLLISEPNPDDPLMADIAREFQSNRPLFNSKAKQWTNHYAKHDPKNPPGNYTYFSFKFLVYSFSITVFTCLVLYATNKLM